MYNNNEYRLSQIEEQNVKIFQKLSSIVSGYAKNVN